MNRFFALPLIALALVSLSSCETTKHRFASASPAPGTVVNWPGVAYKEVRAYCYDYTAESSPSFFINGRMHKGVMDPKGVKLTDAQVKRLLPLLTTSQPRGARTPCYAPHHAFVFYDKAGKVAAYFEMCFGCNQQRSHPGGTPEYIDREALWKFTSELGLPLGKGNQFYTEACRAGRKQ